MTARDDYPLLAPLIPIDLHLDRQAKIALNEIDSLRPILAAALAWRSCKYAMHGSTAEASRRHSDAVRYAESNLNQRLTELLADAAGGMP